MRASVASTVVVVLALCATSCTANLMTGGQAIELVEPEDGATLTGTIDVVIRIAEPGLLGRVDLDIDGTTYASWNDPRSRLEHRLDTTVLEDGLHTLALMDGETAPARELLRRGVMVDNHGPEVTILEPGPSVFLDDGPFPFAIRVTDVSAVERVRMRAGPTVVSEADGIGREEWVVEVDPAMILGAETTGEIPLAVEAFDVTGARTEATHVVDVRRRELWYATEDPTSVAPAIEGDAVAVVTDDGLAVYSSTGTVRCRVPGIGASTSPVALPGDGAVVWSTIERIRIVELSDCAIRWERMSTASDFVTAAAVHEDRVYVTTFTGSLLSFGFDGTGLETVALADALETPPSTFEIGRGLAVAPDGTVWVGAALGAARGAVFQISPTGTVRALEMPSPVDAGITATDDGAFVGSPDGRLYRVGTDMTRAWREEPLLSEGHPLECTPLALEDGTIVTCDGAGRVLGISAADGRTLWQYDASHGRVPFRLLGAGGMSRGGAGNGLLAVGDRLGMLHVLDLEGNLRWR
ncbi:MAG: PQQ-binding-like beta-propeller repeat protein, partial [Deltaproteobacteria bacterium]|nr:PQQ-binding-like beta-propeller repeat protein [Deltaproteobacteria bacterium]